METFDLYRLRKDVGATQIQLAELLGVPQSFVSMVENKKNPMPQAWKDVLARHYNISDISEYISVSEGDTIIHDVNGVAGVGISVANDLNLLFDYLKCRDKEVSDMLRRKDAQIDRLITLLERK